MAVNRARARDDDFKIDFAKHSREVNAAMESDERYWRENDAKFRAVNQKVATYDEFRDIVKAAHLKPLEKGDRISDMKEQFHQPWNIYAKKDGDAVKNTGGSGTSTELSVPKTSLEFARDWKRQRSNSEKLAYITNIPTEHLQHLFHNDSGFGLTGEIIVLFSELETFDTAWTIDLLKILSHCDRFSLSLQFFSSDERRACQALFEKLRAHSAETVKDDLNELSHKYNIES